MNKNLENAKKFKNNALEAGMKGFLVTCNNMQRKDIVRDTCALLNHHADKMYGPEQVMPLCADDAIVNVGSLYQKTFNACVLLLRRCILEYMLQFAHVSAGSTNYR